MKKFERFIIYPLLIVALFYSFAGEQVTEATENVIDKLVVREISVVNDDDKEVINIGSLFSGYHGLINVYDVRDKEKMYSTISSGSFRVVNNMRTGSSASLSFTGVSLKRDDYWNFITSNSISISDDVEYYEIYDDDVPKRRYISLRVDDQSNAFFTINNQEGNPLLYLGPDSSSGHGLINVYDQYSESGKSYHHR